MSLELQLLLILAIIITVSKLSGHLGKKYLHQPVVFGKILAGLILGPTILNILGWNIFADHSGTISEILSVFAGIGVLLLMFIAGLETNLKDIMKVGRTAVTAAVLGVLFPLIFGFLTAKLFQIDLYAALFIGVVLTATSVSISAQTLMEIGSFRTKEGMTIMGAAVIDDILGIIVLSFVIALAPASSSLHFNTSLPQIITEKLSVIFGLSHSGANALTIILTVLLMAIFFVLAVVIAKSAFERSFKIVEKMHASHIITAAAIIFILLSAFFAEYLGQVAAITGAYITGIFVASTNYRERIEKTIAPFTYAFFVPIFFMSIGMSANVREIKYSDIWFIVAIVLVAVITKVLGCGLGAKLTGFNNIESARVGVGMISRGEVGLIIVKIGMDAGIINNSEFTAMVILVLFTTMITPILLRLAFNNKKKVELSLGGKGDN